MRRVKVKMFYSDSDWASDVSSQLERLLNNWLEENIDCALIRTYMHSNSTGSSSTYGTVLCAEYYEITKRELIIEKNG